MITLAYKGKNGKFYPKNWRPTSLLSVFYRIYPKALTNHLKDFSNMFSVQTRNVSFLERLFWILSLYLIRVSYKTPLSNKPGRRFFGGFLMGGSSVGADYQVFGLGTAKLGGGVECEIVGGVGLSCRRQDMQ